VLVFGVLGNVHEYIYKIRYNIYKEFTYGLISVMRPLLHRDSRESLGTSSRETSVFSFCHLILDDSLSASSRVIDEQTTGMAKRDALRGPKEMSDARGTLS